jgi:hypothetical protein
MRPDFTGVYVLLSIALLLLMYSGVVKLYKTVKNRESVDNYDELVNWAIRKYPKSMEYANGILFLVYHYRSGYYNGLAFQEDGNIIAFEKEDNYNPRGDRYGEDRTYKQMQKIIDSLLKDYIVS